MYACQAVSDWVPANALLQAVVDKSPVVASGVLLSALHLISGNPEIIKRWVNEVQEAVQVQTESDSECISMCSEGAAGRGRSVSHLPAVQK